MLSFFINIDKNVFKKAFASFIVNFHFFDKDQNIATICKCLFMYGNAHSHLIVDESPLLQESVHAHNGAHIASKVTPTRRRGQVFRGVQPTTKRLLKNNKEITKLISPI